MDHIALAIEQMPYIKNVAYLVCRNKYTEPQDIIQEVFIDIIRAKPPKDKKMFRSWLYSIIKNAYFECVRQDSRQSRIKERYSKSASLYSHDEKFNQIDNQDTWDKLCGILSPKENLIMRLRYLKKYSTKEISKKTGRSINCINILVLRAKNKLRQRAAWMYKDQPIKNIM